MEKQLIKTPDVAKRLGVEVSHVYYAANEGHYDDFLVRVSPHRLRFDPDKLEEFIQRGGVRQAECDEGMAQAA
jgi:predicted DNA-binding transcriptional regulator AlpA